MFPLKIIYIISFIFGGGATATKLVLFESKKHCILVVCVDCTVEISNCMSNLVNIFVLIP